MLSAVTGALHCCCPFCGSKLDRPVLSAGSTANRSAGELASLHAAAQRQSMHGREEEARGRDEYRQLLGRELAAKGQMTTDTELVVLPAIDRQVVPLSDDRKQKFLRYIATVAEQALNERAEGDPPPTSEPEHHDPSRDRIRVAACTLCHGACCTNGGEHGYLLAGSLLRWMGHGSKPTAAEIVSLYESFLPAATYADSCVFHTDRGCTIPQQYRSNTCNAFICQGLTEYETGGEASTSSVLLTANRNGQMVRQSLVQISLDMAK